MSTRHLGTRAGEHLNSDDLHKSAIKDHLRLQDLAPWGFPLTTGNGLAGRALVGIQRVKQIRTTQLTHSSLLA